MSQLVVVYGAPVRGIEGRQMVPLLGVGSGHLVPLLGGRERPDGAPVRG
jgi:hypothetical protein